MDHFYVLEHRKKGFTIVEIMVVITIIVGVAVAALSALRPTAQIGKGRDAQRKADLQKLKIIFEDYYNDNQCYPPTSTVDLTCNSTALRPYLDKVPCDPGGHTTPYAYTTTCTSFIIYAKLEYDKDSDVVKYNCGNTPGAMCGPSGNRNYNYGVVAGNVSLER